MKAVPAYALVPCCVICRQNVICSGIRRRKGSPRAADTHEATIFINITPMIVANFPYNGPKQLGTDRSKITIAHQVFLISSTSTNVRTLLVCNDPLQLIPRACP